MRTTRKETPRPSVEGFRGLSGHYVLSNNVLKGFLFKIYFTNKRKLFPEFHSLRILDVDDH